MLHKSRTLIKTYSFRKKTVSKVVGPQGNVVAKAAFDIVKSVHDSAQQTS